MGLVQDISDIIRKGPELVSQANSARLNTKSVARGAKDSTFQFPFLITDSAPVDMANVTVQSFDRVYASFTQTWLSMNSMFDITIDPTPLSYLKRLHQNMKVESVSDINTVELTEDEKESFMEKVYDGTYRCYMNKDNTFGIIINEADHGIHRAFESHKEQLNEFMSDYDLKPLVVTEALGDGTSSADLARAIIDSQSKQANDKTRRDILSDSDRGRAPQLLDRDVKKSNDMMPYAIQVRFIVVNDKKEFVQYLDVVIGVKAIMHLVSSDDMIENISRALRNNSVAFKFLRWTTGEISLVKDLILNLNEIRSDAFNRYNGKAPFFGTLKRLKNKKLGLRNITVPTALIPNATVAITSYEADYLRDNYAINVKDPKTATKLLDSLFLMAFVILDEGMGTVSVLYDGDSEFQTYSIDTLQRQNSINANNLSKEIGRMIAK